MPGPQRGTFSGAPPSSALDPLALAIGNGDEPSARSHRSVGIFLNEILAKCRRCVFSHWQGPAWGADPSGTEDTLRFRFRSSPSATVLRIRVSLYPANTTAAADTPGYRWEVNGVAQAWVRANWRDISVSLSLSTLRETETVVTLTRDTAYQFVMTQDDHCRVISVVAWEEPAYRFTSDDTYSTALANVVRGAPILDASIASLYAAALRLWKRQGTHYFSWSTPTSTAVTSASATYVNLIDSSISSVTNAAPGFICRPRFHGTLNSDAVPVELYFYGKVTAGTGSVAFIDAAGTTIATLTTTSTSGTWVTGTGSWTGASAWDWAKVDVHIKCSGGGTISVWGVGMYCYEA